MRVASLFSGAGGLDHGFIDAGHQVIWANDNNVDAVETYKLNIGSHIILGDIRNIPSHSIPEVDIILGGFPCQGFSIANMNRNENDERNYLYLEMLRIITEKQPMFFVAENVKGLLSLSKGKVLEMILQDFDNSGYRVKYKVLNAADYGVPQKRLRVIIIGIRQDLENDIDFPVPTHYEPENTRTFLNLQPWVTIGNALRNIPEPQDAPHIPNHTYSKYKLHFNGYIGNRTIDPSKPAPTVTARGDEKGGVVVLHHPNNHRRMSARELAITQSFPLDYVFCGTRTSVYRQIANAVPPLMAKAIASQFPIHLINTK
jgi:DNA (cytosine-5)-methyltransferase 1